MGVLRNIAKQLLSAGTVVLPEVTIPAGSTKISLITNVTNWPTIPSGIEATVSLALSQDNGSTWQPAMTIAYTGGLDTRTGLPAPGPAPVYDMEIPLANPVRARWTVSLTRTFELSASLEAV